MKSLLFILAFSNLANASEFRTINERTEVLNHQVAIEMDGRTVKEATLNCKDTKKWICFDKCTATTVKIIKDLKNDLTGEMKEEVKYKITVSLTNQKEDQYLESDSLTLSSDEYPLNKNFQRKNKSQSASYKGDALTIESSSIFCNLTDGCPIPVTERVQTKIKVDEQLLTISSFSIKSHYTLRLEKSSDLSCKF